MIQSSQASTASNQSSSSRGRTGFGRSIGRSRRPTSDNLAQYQEPLVSRQDVDQSDLEVATRGGVASNAVAPDATYSDSSQLDTSEYTVNTTMISGQPSNTLLQDVALSQEHMESALTTGNESLHDQTKSTLGQEWCWLIVLIAILWYSNPLDGSSMSEKCGIDPREEIINFVAWILAPTALIRGLVYAAYKTPRNYQTFLSFSFAISVYYHGTFGFWTLENFVRMLQAPTACGKEPVTVVKLIYHVTLIIGAFPAIVFILGTVLFTCFIPYFFYERFQRSQRLRQQEMKTTEMLDEMFNVKWNPKVLTYQDECCICLGEFEVKQNVVALPCDFKHYFHHGCIENWFKFHTACPFCKSEVTIDAIRKTKPDYEARLKQIGATASTV